MKYPLCEKMGVKVERVLNTKLTPDNSKNSSTEIRDIIYAYDIEKILEGAVKVCGHNEKQAPAYWGPKENGQFNDTHTGLVVCIEEIPKKPEPKVEITKSEFDSILDAIYKDPQGRSYILDDEIKKRLFPEVQNDAKN